MTDAHLGLAARTLLFDAADKSPIFCVGSGGLSYGIGSALVGLDNTPVNEAALPPSGIALAVSGSCSGRTAQQIQQAIGAGWLDLRIDPNRIDAGVERAIAAATSALRSGRSVVAYTALGRADGDFSAARFAHALARLVEATLRTTKLRRVIVAGGDTSGHAVRALPIAGLTVRRSVVPAGVLCTAASPQGWMVGAPGLFETVRLGI